MTAQLVADVPAARAEGIRSRRVVVLVCDSLGIGAAPDAAAYGDDAADTLAHVAAAAGGLTLPTLSRWGLGRLTAVEGVPPAEPPAAVVARLTPTSAGKDSTTGHWELMGQPTREPFPVYPQGFPADVVDAFSEAIGRPVLGNRPASGTAILEEFGEQHLRTGAPIVYTSADSVFQVAAHVDVVTREELYRWCEIARALLGPPHQVGRVIARPFEGAPGSFRRTPHRRDYAVPPPEPTTCDLLHEAGVPVKAVGKIEDLFVRRGITWSDHTTDNPSSVAAVMRFLEDEGPAFVFANLVDFDQLYGHRNDPMGYARALEAFDDQVSALAAMLDPSDRLLVTADHGTDPTLPSTDHTRELVPLLGWGPDLAAGVDLGARDTMADVGATVLELFGLPSPGGTSFAACL